MIYIEEISGLLYKKSPSMSLRELFESAIGKVVDNTDGKFAVLKVW